MTPTHTISRYRTSDFTLLESTKIRASTDGWAVLTAKVIYAKKAGTVVVENSKGEEVYRD